MKQNAKLLIACLITLNISGCGVDTIFSECHTPKVTKPTYDNKNYKTILQKSKQCLRNHAIKDKYIKELEAANDVCK